MAPHTAGAFFCHTNEMCDISATFTVQRCYTPTLLQSLQGLRKAIPVYWDVRHLKDTLGNYKARGQQQAVVRSYFTLKTD